MTLLLKDVLIARSFQFQTFLYIPLCALMRFIARAMSYETVCMSKRHSHCFNFGLLLLAVFFIFSFHLLPSRKLLSPAPLQVRPGMLTTPPSPARESLCKMRKTQSVSRISPAPTAHFAWSSSSPATTRFTPLTTASPISRRTRYRRGRAHHRSRNCLCGRWRPRVRRGARRSSVGQYLPARFCHQPGSRAHR